MACMSSGSVPTQHAAEARAIAPDAPDVTIAAGTCSSPAMVCDAAWFSAGRDTCDRLAECMLLATSGSIRLPPLTV